MESFHIIPTNATNGTNLTTSTTTNTSSLFLLGSSSSSSSSPSSSLKNHTINGTTTTTNLTDLFLPVDESSSSYYANSTTNNSTTTTNSTTTNSTTTLPPTLLPTTLPSISPTSSPTVFDTYFTCPPVNEKSFQFTLPSTTTTIQLASSFAVEDGGGDLCTLRRVTSTNRKNNDDDDDDTATIVPIARTYDGNDWEIVAGEYISTATLECFPSSYYTTTTTTTSATATNFITNSTNSTATNSTTTNTTTAYTTAAATTTTTTTMIDGYCNLTLPNLLHSLDDNNPSAVSSSSTYYELSTYKSHLNPYHPKDCTSLVSRFFEQVTFGPTPFMIRNWWGCPTRDAEDVNVDLQYTFETYINNQMDTSKVSITSHREFYRKYLNPRLEIPLKYGHIGPSPCSMHSRWRTAAFSVKDSFKILHITSLHGHNDRGPYIVWVDGQIRTIVSSISLMHDNDKDDKDSWIPTIKVNKKYQFCNVDNDGYWYQDGIIGSIVRLKLDKVRNPKHANQCYQLKDGNPPINLNGFFKNQDEEDEQDNDDEDEYKEEYDNLLWNVTNTTTLWNVTNTTYSPSFAPSTTTQPSLMPSSIPSSSPTVTPIIETLNIITLPNINDGLSAIDTQKYKSSYWDYMNHYEEDEEFILDETIHPIFQEYDGTNTTNHTTIQSSGCERLLDAWGNSTTYPDTIDFPLEPIFGQTKRFNSKTGKLETIYLLYDPRFVIMENTITNPIPDGGGTISRNTNGKTLCSNVPRTFLNEDSCILSRSSTACSAETIPTFSVTLNDDFLIGLYELTGRYVYALTNLPPLNSSIINEEEYETYMDENGITQWYVPPPCRSTRGSYLTRWMRILPEEDDGDDDDDDDDEDINATSTNPKTKRIINPCSGEDFQTIGSGTAALFGRMLRDGFEDPTNPKPLLKDIQLSDTVICDVDDIGKPDLGYVLSEDGICWQHVHPQHLNIYDFTDWVHRHFGGSNPIRYFAEKKISSRLIFPSHHHYNGNYRIYENIVFNQTVMMDANMNSPKQRSVNSWVGKYGDTIPYSNLPSQLQGEDVESDYGTVTVNPSGEGVVVCGSLGEVANEPLLGSGFDFATRLKFPNGMGGVDTTNKVVLQQQRNTIWSYIALQSQDQFRQRVAFALSQILVITPLLIGDISFTEAILQYYDIFVRHAFGSYRDILKEVSFSHPMGYMLSSIRSKSYQYSVDYGAPSFPDENFAREIMQLFSIGLIKLNMDGTPLLGENGLPIETYDNSDIMSFSRAWTGFQPQRQRGNLESRRFRTEPMNINGRWRDVFPKSDLYGGFIGDNYPLCVDLPKQHFLRRGATYRLMGSKASPELQEDWQKWDDDPEVIRLELKANSSLCQKLCNNQGSGCEFPAKVVLDSNLPCHDIECTSDTLRTIRIQSDPFPVYYEYVRQPCVEQAFFENGKRVLDYTRNDTLEVRNNMCADPRRDVAAEGCCRIFKWQDQVRMFNVTGFRFCNYQGERLTFPGAVQRCNENEMAQCFFRRIGWKSGTCSKGSEALVQKLPLFYYWTTSSCWVVAKVAKNGDVAIVHNPELDHAGIANVESKVARSNSNFFKVSWEGGVFPKASEGCGSLLGCDVVNDECLCPTNVEETPLFSTELPTRDQILSEAKIGAFHPDTFDAGTFKRIDCGGLIIHVKNGDCSKLGTDAVFFVVDDNGIERYLKNMKSIVSIAGNFTFRNPVHFMSLVDPEVRDAYYETDAVLDHYFHHPNHPPFLAKNMIQRFGISNPSPGFVKVVAEAYKNGFYIGSFGHSFGSGNYGDLGAMMAAITLEPESRSVSLDSDPSHGSLREPILKVVGVLRALLYKTDAPMVWPLLASLQKTIGQCIYEAPSVFSFFLPEYVPSGPLGTASLVSPEAQTLTGSKITAILNGIFSTINFGITNCHGGFAGTRPRASWGECPKEGDFKSSFGFLTYKPDTATLDSTSSFRDIVDDLALLLTSSRLLRDNRNIIEKAMGIEHAKYLPSYPNKAKASAIRLGQMLIASTPEFHSTNIVRRNQRNPRKTQPQNSGTKRRYKAVVYLMFEGGMDSYNLLVPKNCTGHSKDLYSQYSAIRTVKALPQWKLNDINATGSGQPCDTFGVNSEIPVLKRLYDSGEVMFMANAGVLQRPVSKDEWQDETNTRLFSHNSQQRETYRVDIQNEMGNTGVGGRIIDALASKGFKTSAAFIGTESPLLEGDPSKNNPLTELPDIAPQEFYQGSSSDLLEQAILDLNGETAVDSGLFGETWSSKVVQAIAQNKEQLKYYGDPAFQVRNRFPGTGLGNNLRSVSQWILNRNERMVEREIFHVVHSGYDHHNDPYHNRLEGALKDVNSALEAFVKEMKDANVWDDIVVVTGSDFGRTLTPNTGGGTDHAWGGNYFLMGGSVKGHQIKGIYPDDLTENGSRNIGRGRFIPSLPLDSYWNGIAQWLGVTNACSLNYILPNRHNFECGSTLFTDMDLFHNGKLSYCSLGDGQGGDYCFDDPIVFEDSLGSPFTGIPEPLEVETMVTRGGTPPQKEQGKDFIGSPMTGMSQRLKIREEAKRTKSNAEDQVMLEDESLPIMSPSLDYIALFLVGLVVGGGCWWWWRRVGSFLPRRRNDHLGKDFLFSDLKSRSGHIHQA